MTMDSFQQTKNWTLKYDRCLMRQQHSLLKFSIAFNI
ncbi:hypothetical protein SNEBB_001895, partial [Seison nebaliae]